MGFLEQFKQSLSFVYDVFVVATAYFALVAIASYFGGVPLTTGAPFWLAKSFKLQWPLWWSASVASDILLATLALGFNPLRNIGDYGSAEFATERQIKAMGLRHDKGVIFGVKGGRYLRNNDPLSAIIIAPPDSGKTAGLLVPTLVSCGDSMIISDIKPELYALTAARRAQFSKVLKFAPGEKDSLQWNPLHKRELPADWNDIVIHVERVARTMYISDKDGKADYWTDEGRSTFIMFALYLIHLNGQTSIPEIRASVLKHGADVPGEIARILDDTPNLPARIQEEGATLLGKGDREFSSIFGTFKNGLNVYADPRVAHNMTGCDFCLDDLRRETTSLYLTVNDADARRLSPVLSMFFEFANAKYMSKLPGNEEKSIVFMLEEFVRLGRIDEIISSPALARGYRLRYIFVMQSWSQVQDLYGEKKADTLKNTCAFHLYFTQNDEKVAESISRSIGKKTRQRLSFSSGDRSLTRNKQESAEGQPLMLAQDIMSMPTGDILILRQKHFQNPVYARAPFWFKDRALLPHVSPTPRLSHAKA